MLCKYHQRVHARNVAEVASSRCQGGMLQFLNQDTVRMGVSGDP